MSNPAISRFKEFYLVGLLALWLLAGCAGYAACILYTADVREAVALANDFPQHWHTSGGTQTEFEKLRLVLASVAIVLGVLGGVWALHLRRHGHLSYRRWRAGWPQAWRGLAQGWRSLQPRQQRLTLVVFAALTVLRIIVSRVLVTFDDGTSYEGFVRKSLLVVSAWYPIPNNHIFSNTLSWLFYQAYPGYWWSMRVPVLILSTAATAGWFLGLLRRSNFRVAALATALFSLLELSLFYAAEGRGYALLLALSGLGFLCTLSLTDLGAEAAAPTLAWAWAGLAAAGIVGLYTVPTFAYFLVAAYSWLAFCWLRKGYYPRLASLGLVSAATLLGAALLYAPLLLVSGPGSLLQNKYVKPLAAATFFRQLPAYLWGVEGALLGESHKGVLASLHLGSLAAVAVLVGFLALLGAARRGRLPAHQATYILRIGVPAVWFTLLPYALLLAQRVQAPDRTLWFKAAFMFLLVGLEADWLLHQLAVKSRLVRTGLLLGAGLWAGGQLVQLYRSNELRLSYLKTPHAAAHWLLHQPPGPILAPDSPFISGAIRFFIHAEEPTSLLEVDATPRPGTRYRYRVDPPAASPTPTSAALPHLHIDRDVNSEALEVTAYW